MIYAQWVENDGRFAFAETDNGGVQITKAQHAELIAGNQGGRAIGRDANGLPMLAETTLDELRQAKIAEIAASCEAELSGGFITASGIKMDSTLAALQKIKIGYDFALMIGETVMTVVDFDNVGHADLPIADVQALMLQTGGHYRDLYIKKQTLRGQALAAANAGELDLIVW